MNERDEKRYRVYELPLALLALAAILVGALTATNATYAQGQPNVVAVELVEYEIRMPTTLPAGPTTFEVTNNGSVDHNFRIEGQGMIDGFANDFPPGQTQILELDLPAGEYEVYSPISNFADQGMRLTLTVTEEDAAATESSAATTPVTTTATTDTITDTVAAGSTNAITTTGATGTTPGVMATTDVTDTMTMTATDRMTGTEAVTTTGQ